MFEKGKVIDIHVYTETKKGTGEFKLELATVKTLPDGRVSDIGYIYIKSQGWLVKPRKCKSYKRKKAVSLAKVVRVRRVAHVV